MKKNDKIYVAGHNGMVGSAICRRLLKDGFKNIVTRNHSELELCDQAQVKAFFETEKPRYVFLAAGKIGGVFANNTYRADFIYENIMIQSNIIHNAFVNEVKKLLFLSSADVYPRNNLRPARENDLLTGSLEPTCEPFAVAKLAGMKMCESYNRQYGTDFIVVTPPNAYGPNQHYDILNAQVLPSLIKKLHEAKTANLKEVVLWGTGSPVRDFLFVDDIADACLFLMENCTGSDYFNIGTGKGCTIAELASTVKKAVGYKGRIVFDRTKPDGVKRKLLDISKITKTGWAAATDLATGIKITYRVFLKELKKKEMRISRICDIKKIEKDISMLNKIKSLSKHISTNIQPATYRNRVVIKPWGYEFLVFKNREVAVWLLYIVKGNATSMHCHPHKKTSLIILSGRAVSTTFSSRNYLQGGDALILEKGVFHFTKVLSDEGAYLLEIETPPRKTDLVRIEDRYGREKSGYEGVEEMETQNLKEYNYFSFDEASKRKNTYESNRFIVSFEVFSADRVFKRFFKIDTNGLYTSCGGRLLDKSGGVLLDTGETQKAEVLSNIKGMHISKNLVLLKTLTKDKY